MTDKDVLERFVAIIGVGKVFPITPRQPHHKPAWQWYTTEFDFYVVANLLRPFLGARRARAIDDAIKRRADYVAEKTEKARCKVCGTFFERDFRRGKPILFCSADCRKKRTAPVPALVRSIARPETF
jgi:hypothetical protein